MFKLTSNKEFTSSFQTEEVSEGVTIVHLTAKASGEPCKLELDLAWSADDIRVNAVWSPMCFRNKTVRPEWGAYYDSNATSSAPILTNLAYDDTNTLTIACSDAKNIVHIRAGVEEETARLLCNVKINIGCKISDYSADVRIDTRRVHFSVPVKDTVKWWESYPGYEPASVPKEARDPLYSAWYSFHQSVDVEKIVEECKYFGALGCKTLIVDDGWETDDTNRGFAYCGDWEVTPSKIPDMKSFVERVHETGMKFVLWYSVPFLGKHSKAYERFKDKVLGGEWLGAYTLDPRYPEVREYLIGTYKKAVLDWDLDGFKLDFIDSIYQTDAISDEMDYISVFDAVDRLMKDVIRELKALKPDILIEFRQSYMGPLMRTFGNMIRSSDCPNDSLTNRLNTLSLRLTSGNTAVHSDMIMFSGNESADEAAFQLTNILFSVPQISVRHDMITEEQAKMVRFYLENWVKYRSVLLDGDLRIKNYTADCSYVYSIKDSVQVGAVYSGRIAYIEELSDEIVVINATYDKEVIFDFTNLSGAYSYTVFDCMGNTVSRGGILFRGGMLFDDDLMRIPAPVNGYIILKK